MNDESLENIYGKLKEKIIAVRLESVVAATSRTRKTFLIMTVFCAAINIALWNGYLSWVRDMAMPKIESESNNQGTNDSKIVEAKKKANENKKVLVDEWIRSQTISFNLLGIKLTTFDLSVLGSISLVVVMIWYFFTIRRENRTIVPFLKEISDEVYNLKNIKDKNKRKEAIDLANLVFLGIVNSTVFINIADNDNPSKIIKTTTGDINLSFKSDSVATLISLFFISTATLVILLSFFSHWGLSGILIYLGIPKPFNLFTLVIPFTAIITILYCYSQKKRSLVKIFYKWVKKIFTLKKSVVQRLSIESWWEENKDEAVFFRWIIYLLIFLPSITIFLIILSDISSLFSSSAYRTPDELLIVIIWRESRDVIYKILIFELIAFVSFLMTTYLSLRIVNFSRAIRYSLNTFYKEFIKN